MAIPGIGGPPPTTYTPSSSGPPSGSTPKQQAQYWAKQILNLFQGIQNGTVILDPTTFCQTVQTDLDGLNWAIQAMPDDSTDQTTYLNLETAVLAMAPTKRIGFLPPFPVPLSQALKDGGDEAIWWMRGLYEERGTQMPESVQNGLTLLEQDS